MNDIWLFQAFGDEVYTKFIQIANCLQQRFAITQKSTKNYVKKPETHTSYSVVPVNA
jgi:hypothetical protein